MGETTPSVVFQTHPTRCSASMLRWAARASRVIRASRRTHGPPAFGRREGRLRPKRGERPLGGNGTAGGGVRLVREEGRDVSG